MGVHCLPAGDGQEGGAKHRETDVGSCVEEVAHRTERAERNRMAAARKIPQRPRTPMTVNHSSIAASERELAKLPRLMALHKTVAKRPRLKAYLVSEQHVPFRETGIFRRYP